MTLPLLTAVRRRPTTAFFALAYGFSWTLWLSALALFPPELPPARRAPAQLLLVVGTFGPFVAAVVVAWATETVPELKARLLRWRVAPRWYAVALLLPILAVAVAYGVYRFLGGPPVQPSRTIPASALLVVFAFTLIAGGGNEEPGWRGFALPRLQRRFGPVVGTLVLAVLWAGWHLPAFLDPASSQSALPPLAWALGVAATSLVLTWLFNVAAESVPVVALYHATFNVAGLWVLGGLPVDAIGRFYWIGVAVFGVVAAGLVVATWFHLGFPRRRTVAADGGRSGE